MGILLASANFDLFLDKIESGQRLADAGDSENPLYRFVETGLSSSISFMVFIMHLSEKRFEALLSRISNFRSYSF